MVCFFISNIIEISKLNGGGASRRYANLREDKRHNNYSFGNALCIQVEASGKFGKSVR